jgi:hypothetical protein
VKEISVEEIDWASISGLDPEALCLVGKGYIREELKSECFARGLALGPQSIHSLVDLAKRMTQNHQQLISSLGRITLLEDYLRSRAFRARFPELCVSRDRSRYASRLDRELLRGRSMFIRPNEAVVHHELLTGALGADDRRTEYFVLAQLLEERMRDLGVVDDVLLLRNAVIGLEDGSLDLHPLPQRIFWFHLGETTPLEDAFLDLLKKHCDFVSVKRSQGPLQNFTRRSCHTIEDAISFVFDQSSIDSSVLVIEDVPEVRRAVRRALKARGLFPADPRNPMALLESEPIKAALSSAVGFPSGKVTLSEVVQWVKALPELEPIHGAVELWEKENASVGFADQRLPSAYWLRGLRESVRSLKPPPERLRPVSSLLVLRFDQVPALRITQDSKIHLLGVSENWFNQRPSAWQWYSDAECGVLRRDFPLFDRTQIENLQKEFIINWLQMEAELVAWEPNVGLDGKDRNDLTLEWTRVLGEEKVPTIEAMGAHPFWNAALLQQPRSIARAFDRPIEQLMNFDAPQPMSLLDDYLKCPYLAYGTRVMRLRDKDEIDPELPGNLWGELLHHAIFLMTSKNEPMESALEMSWTTQVLGKAQVAPRMERAARAKALLLLKEFVRDEAAYRESSQAIPELFESDLKLVLSDVKFRGRADRIDRHPDGYVVLDYKTAKSGAPGGLELFSKGLGGQLAVYALALKEQTNEEVIGALYVLLNEPITRKKGFIFKKYPILKLGGGVNFSRVSEDPEVIWGRARVLMEESVKKLASGHFWAAPASEKNCVKCRMRLSCGEGRRSLDSEEGDFTD